ncbi:CaiB/BaiF CoA transferase family protein [Rhodococcus sp. IEGM1428]|uniref:CaiB/BaiF CoA transferase family protein n=1 Tax=Rhodococcus sp. IEGM1428 TaxID=3392191 RepID=UPI003D1252F6
MADDPGTSAMWNCRRGPLRGMRVLVGGQTVTAQLLASLLADWGADVVVLEPIAGHRGRRVLRSDEHSALWWKARARNTRSVSVDENDRESDDVIFALGDAADVVIDSPGSGLDAVWGTDLSRIRSADARAVTMSISPYGSTGPMAGTAGDETTAEAFAGLAHMTGDPAREPLHSDYPVGAAATALMGGLSVMAGLYRRDHLPDGSVGVGVGSHIDLSMADTVLRILEFLPAYHDQLGWVPERTDSTSPYQVPVNRWRTADGVWMSFTGNTQDVVARFLRGIDRADLVEDERFATNAARVANKAELERIIATYFAEHTHADVEKSMERNGVPIAAILSIAEVFEQQQYRERGTLTEFTDPQLGTVHLPNVAVRFSRSPGRIDRLGPDLDQDREAVVREWISDRETPVRGGRVVGDAGRVDYPLVGLRVVDNANVLAGPLCATLLADLGADVIKTERPGTGDLFRSQAPLKNGVSVWWKVMGRGKRSIALDLKTESDRESFLGLVDHADVVVENFVPGVSATMGIDPAQLLDLNPSVIPVQISGYGQQGPLSRRRAFGRNAEAYSGMASMTGYRGALPQHTGFPVADSFSGMFAAFGALAAVYERDTSGSGLGQSLDVALFESVFRFMEPQALIYDRTGEIWERGRALVEPGLWRRVIGTKDGRWLTISASDMEALGRIAEWTGVCAEALMDPELDLAEFGGAEDAETRLDEAVRRSIACALDSTIEDLIGSAHIADRGMLVTVDDPDLGPILMPGIVPAIDGHTLAVRGPAPALGGDRGEILAQWCGVRT